MPTDIKLNTETHDIDLSSGTLDLFLSNTDVVAQRVKIAILKKQGEWFRDSSEGVPYYQEFFTKRNNKKFVDQFMVSYISSVEDVNAVLSYESSITAGRILAVSVIIETDFGAIVTLELGDV